MGHKNISEVGIMLQSRLNSQRIPQKMIKDFAGTSLLDILLEKLVTSNVIPTENIFLSAYEPEIKAKAEKWGVEVFHRSEASANEEKSLQTICEWHDKMPYKYTVSFSGTQPLLKQSTMESFYTEFINSDKEGMYGVYEKKTHYWDKDGNKIEAMSENQRAFNTKFIDPVYEAGHCMAATRTDIIKDGYYISKDFPSKANLFIMSELEAWDIDEPWQFEVAEKLYETL